MNAEPADLRRQTSAASKRDGPRRTAALRFPFSVFRPLGRNALLLLVLLAVPWPAWIQAQEISPLPPPVTRGLYRSHWFEFLNAHLEDDPRAAAKALGEIKRAAQAVGIHRLSDFSRAAAHEALKAARLGRPDRAERAYESAVALDDANYDALVSEIGFLLRQRSYQKAIGLLPRVTTALLATHESRLALLSSLALWIAFAIATATLGSIVILLLRHFPRFGHDVAEVSNRFLGPKTGAPLVLILLALPVAFGLGPIWLLSYWGILIHAYVDRGERTVLAAALLVFGLLTPFLEWVSHENIIERSPLYVAAVDLEERREDGSAEDGLRQAAVVFSEDPDVWFLIGIYAERAGDTERALASYDRAIQTGPKDYRAYLNRGNVRFQEGEYGQAIRDYEAAAERAPRNAEIHYNLSIARGEAYDFEGQAAEMARARQVSEGKVADWSNHPTLARVISAPYTVARARQKIEQWNAQPKSRRLPGHARPYQVLDVLLSPFTLAPWLTLLLASGLTAWRSHRGTLASECARCGKPFCRFCKRVGDPILYCSSCIRLFLRKESVDIQAQVAQTHEIRLRIRQADRTCRLTSLLFPGSHHYFSQRPSGGFFVLLFFFLFAAMAWVDERVFDPRQLHSPEGWRITGLVALAAAVGVWIVSQVTAWRESHGA